MLIADVPRSNCPEHGPLQVTVPWAEAGSRFTALFEALVIDWLHEASLSGVARQVRITWDEADGIQTRAVRRGLARRERRLPTRIGVDETSFQKRHEYVTVVIDQVAGDVVHVADDRKRASLETYLAGHSVEERAAVETVAMDMHQPYIQAVKATIPLAALKICFDKFHVASHLGQAVDRVRREENRALLEEGDGRLKRTKYLWLTHPANLTDERWASFAKLRESASQDGSARGRSRSWRWSSGARRGGAPAGGRGSPAPGTSAPRLTLPLGASPIAAAPQLPAPGLVPYRSRGARAPGSAGSAGRCGAGWTR
ncbi:MAG: ISL3 family transposase [Deltaproteobacteria bacterium]|nr:ISL3 family transposase [Deltaproteobacteria bacterium]